jgi:hypothetical protein
VALTTHPYLVLRLKMSGAIPLLPYTPSWRVTTFKDKRFFTLTKRLQMLKILSIIFSQQLNFVTPKRADTLKNSGQLSHYISPQPLQSRPKARHTCHFTANSATHVAPRANVRRSQIGRSCRPQSRQVSYETRKTALRRDERSRNLTW